MWKELKSLSAVNGSDWAVVLAGPAAVFLLLQLIIDGVMLAIKPDESILISCILMAMVTGVCCYIISHGNFLITFPQLVRYGVTRKRAFALVGGMTGLMALSSAVLSSLLILFERTFAMHIWRFLSGNPALLVDDFGYIWWAVPLGALGGWLIGLIGAAIVLRFGSKGQLAGVLLYFGGLFGFQMLPWKTHEVTNVLIPALVVFAIAATVWAVWTLLRLRITK